MNLLEYLTVCCANVPVAGPFDEEIKPTLEYIMSGRDYKERVRRANKLKFTYLPQQDNRRPPQSMNLLQRFLNGGWRRCRWEVFELKEETSVARMHKKDSRKAGFGRKLSLAFIGAIFTDLALGFIIWLIIMMGISELGLENKFSMEIDPLNLLYWIWAILFVVFFLAILGLVKTK